MREYYQHQWERFGTEVGPNAWETMIDYALKNPDGAEKRWNHLLELDGMENTTGEF